MTQKNVCVVVTSRASYARIKSLLSAIQGHDSLRLQLVVAASALLHRYGSVVDVIESDGFKPNATVHVVIEGTSPETMAASTGLAIIQLSSKFQDLKPDVVLTIADRYETMATAIAASYMNIPLAHTQGGEVTGSIDDGVRNAVSRLAQLHLVSTDQSRSRLIQMGEDPTHVKLTGCPSIDLIANTSLDTDGLLDQYGGVGLEVDLTQPYLVVLQHPVTTEYEHAFDQIAATLEAIKGLKIPTIWFWPNVDAGSDEISKGLRRFREQTRPDYVHFYRNFTPEDFVRLIANCACLVGNSSAAIREGSFLGTPAVNIGTRQQGRERGDNVIDVQPKPPDIITAIKTQLAHGRYHRSSLYGDGKAGRRIADALAEPLPPIQKSLTY